MDKKFQLRVEILKTSHNTINMNFGINFHIESIFSKFTELIPDELKSIFNYLINKKIISYDKENIGPNALMKLLNVYLINDNVDEIVCVYKIGIIWNDNFDDFEWINYDKKPYK